MDQVAKIEVFENGEIQLRTIVVDGVPWFLAADACRALDIKEPKDAVARLDEDERGRFKTPTPGGDQEMSYVTEAGLYSLILGSRKPEARAFKRWVTHEVLPALRKTGKYEVARPDWSIPQTYADALLLAAQQAKALEAAAPKVAFYDTVVADDGWFTLQKAAGEMNIKGLGRNNLFKFLRDSEIFTPSNVPYRRHQEAGYFRLQPVQTPIGVRMQPMVSQRGIDFILRTWNKAQAVTA